MPPHAWVSPEKNKYVTASKASTLELGGLGGGMLWVPPQEVQGRALVGIQGGKAPGKFCLFDP